MTASISPGHYRHFKGNEYEVLALAKHSETGELLVVYRDLHSPEKVWARPYDMFCGTVERDGKTIPRFTPIP